jgi:DNA (cytosine-5)-methyltransferase 1
MRRAIAIDVFSGAGGLSLGLTNAGFRVAAAVEIDTEATQTYKANHRRTRVLNQDVRTVQGTSLKKDLRCVDLLAGCAPCQGFSSLTQKQRREDPRNTLVLEMARLAEELRPRVFLMENVPGVLTRGKKLYRQLVQRLEDSGYRLTEAVLQMADYGVPQSRRRLVLLGGRGFKLKLPEPTHDREGRENRLPWRTLRNAIGGMPTPPSLSKAWKRGGPRIAGWHVVRDLQAQTERRLRAAIPGGSWQSVRASVRPKCHRGSYVGFTNVYGRMTWDEPSVTMTAGCTTPCKGRFGHPDRRRTTISVREAALIQTFPTDYAFETDGMECVCEMLGNAVPPLFAKVLGASILADLRARFPETGYVVPRVGEA